jgi:endonuclease/exonuclease/phosphatase family metal-dependent hydrolase
VDSVVWLSRRLGMAHAFAGGTESFGNALLTRYAMDADAFVYGSQAPAALRRTLVEARITTTGGALHLFLAHGHQHRATRQAQAAELAERAAAARGAVIVGDLNAPLDAPEMAPLFRAGFRDAFVGGTGTPTWPAKNPTVRIDHVLIGPDVASRETRVWPVQTSDHLPVSARVEVASE